MEFAPLDELYLQWLYSQVANARLKNPARTFWGLMKQLYSSPFVYFVGNDDNRSIDGKELRYEFLDAMPDCNPDSNWLHEDASWLEVLTALSRRLSFADERASSAEWFWRLLANAGIDYPDSEYIKDAPLRVAEKLDMLNNRTYDINGNGGLFPLERTDVDQRQVELWYQMQYYLIERS